MDSEALEFLYLTIPLYESVRVAERKVYILCISECENDRKEQNDRLRLTKAKIGRFVLCCILL